MRLIVDSNILFTFFWKNATATDLFVFQNLELCSPEFALEEIQKYKQEIVRKAKMTDTEFREIKKELQLLIAFVAIEEYMNYFQNAAKISPDKEDVDFFALALLKDCPIWSNDKKLKEQNEVKILTTKEVIELFD